MSDLILDSLEIKNFRLFKHLEIERLGRVNLIVGKNSVGKTTLLEAIRIYAYRGLPSIIEDILRDRDEVSYELARSKANSSTKEWDLALSHLFYGRPELIKGSPTLSIGPMQAEGNRLSLTIEQILGASKSASGPQFVARMGTSDQFKFLLFLEEFAYPQWVTLGLNEVNCLFVAALGLQDNRVSALWDDIVLTDREDVVLDALRIIAPEVQRLNFILPEPQRIPVVKVENLPYPVPLRSLGEGMNRLLGIALALVNAKDGIFLIDEIESGLHYSVQPDMWRLVFETAAKLNVQVFATTHSLDCLRAFESAAKERGEEESLLISLRRHHDEPEKIVAVLAGKEDLDIIIHSHIEAR